MNRLGRALCAVVVAAAFTACGGSDGESAGDGGGGDGVLATLEVMNADVSVRTDTADPFESVTGSRDLGQGDEVRTDATGFAEVVFFDGSWQRIEAGTTLTLTELVDIEGGNAVRTGMDRGRAWQRVETLTNDDDAFQVDTPVAVASVRGTAWATECIGDPIACTYSVLDGIVDLSLSDGTSVELTAGRSLTVRQHEPVGAPQDVGVEQLGQDPWIANNLALDATDPPTAPGGDPGQDDGPVDGAAAVFVAEANAICQTAGEQNAAIGAGTDGDEAARQQADVLDAALDRLQELDPPPDSREAFEQMIDNYRRRTALVRQAMDAPAAERLVLVSQLLDVTASGAERARNLDLVSCIVTSN